MNNSNYVPPKLKHWEGSWMIVNRETGEAVTEIFKSDKRIKQLNATKYEAVPSATYLSGLNRKK